MQSASAPDELSRDQIKAIWSISPRCRKAGDSNRRQPPTVVPSIVQIKRPSGNPDAYSHVLINADVQSPLGRAHAR